VSVREGLTRIALELIKARAVQPALTVTYLLTAVIFVVLESVATSASSVYLCRVVAWGMVALALGAAIHDLWQRMRRSNESGPAGPTSNSRPTRHSAAAGRRADPN
jgi:hypothetical protein